MRARNAIVVGGTGDIGKAVVDRFRAEGLRAASGVKHETPDALWDEIRLLPPGGVL